MKKTFVAFVLTTVLAPALAQAADHSPKPRLSMATARAHALKLAAGKVISEEYEHEGSGWRYSFDIRLKDRTVQEIGIDAMTGKVVENKSEGLHDKD